MQVLILGDDHGQQARLAAAMMKKGFQVICVETARAASSYIRGQFIDVLILAETRSGPIGQSCACVAQSRNPQVSVIVITDRTGAATDELFDEVPLLYGVIGLEMAPGMVAAIALASILPPESGLQRVADPVQQAMVPEPQPAVVGQVRAEPVAEGRVLLQPIARAAPAPRVVAALITQQVPRSVPPVPLVVAQSARDAASPALTSNFARSTVADFDPELAALERELDLVNRDRPSVLAASITEELPSWSQSAPKLAQLTDWTPPGATAVGVPKPAAAAGQTDRRLALGLHQTSLRGVTIQ